jgi:hypothetical protein
MALKTLPVVGKLDLRRHVGKDPSHRLIHYFIGFEIAPIRN